jgi:integrase
MPTLKSDQTIDPHTVKLAWDKAANDWRRSKLTGNIDYACITRPDGRKNYWTTGCADEPNAAAFVRALKADLLEHLVDKHVEPTFAEIAEIYAREKRLNGSFKYVIGMPLKTFGDRRLSSISAPEILAYKATRRATVGDGRIRNEVGYIKTIRQFAVDHEFIPYEKAVRLSKIERPKEEAQPERVALTADETDALWLMVTAYRHGNARHATRLSRAARWGAIAIDTGARKMAICTLRWAQVDFANELIRFDKCEEKIPANKKRGVSPMSPRLKAFLIRARAEATGPYVLDSPADIEGMWSSAVRGSEFERVHPHLLRHTFITQMILNGTDVYIVGKMVGDNPLTLIKRYEHILPDSVRSRVKWNDSQKGAPLRLVAAE